MKRAERKAKRPRRLPAITASMFFKYSACPHWPYFDVYGDPSERGEISPFQEQLIENGLLHEERVLKDMEYVAVEGGTLDERFTKTVGLMKKGVPCIYHGVLMADDMVGEPDLLERRDGSPSNFGGYRYDAVDIKSAERLSDGHRYELSLYGELLGKAQGVRPDQGFILNASGTRIGFRLDEFRPRFQQALRDLRAMLAGEMPKPHVSSGCKTSPWFSQCVAVAERARDIALLYNVRKVTFEALRAEGILTIDDAAAMDPAAVAERSPTLRMKTLERIRLQAKALIDGRHVIRKQYRFREPDLELFFDIEGDPLRQLEYLFGFLSRKNDQEDYRAFIAEKPEEESVMWDRFLAWIDTLPEDYAVYHYGTYETHRIEALRGRHGGSKALDVFVGNMVDLNEIVKKHVVFPLYFYGIKDIGNYIGFRRKGEISGGGESITYYERWLESGDRKQLDAVIEYNTDDVVATRHLKDWLVGAMGEAGAS